jgi:hypothetical protein
MTFFRRHRLTTVFVALFSLLFMQVAVARYVCPATATSGTQASMVMADGMPCAESMSMTMDEGQPALCHAHCKADKQSLDKYELPAPVALGDMPANFTLAVVIPEFSGAALQAPHLRHATAPPVAIQNCCFRI